MRNPLRCRRVLVLGGLLLVCAAPASVRSADVEERPELARLFAAENTRGVIAIYDQRRDRLIVSERARAETGFRPKSTFKIANALIALETGVAKSGEEPVFRWDGQKRSIEAWNRDHTLASAFKVSAVPVFQEIARRIGAERMRGFVEAFDYGNRTIEGAPLDFFWLGGDLRISALQQIAFLRKLHAGALPVSGPTQAVVRDIMAIEPFAGGTLSGKTGASLPGEPDAVGWVVGWFQRDDAVLFYALNLDLTAAPLLARRIPIAKAALDEVLRQ